MECVTSSKINGKYSCKQPRSKKKWASKQRKSNNYFKSVENDAVERTVHRLHLSFLFAFSLFTHNQNKHNERRNNNNNYKNAQKIQSDEISFFFLRMKNNGKFVQQLRKTIARSMLLLSFSPTTFHNRLNSTNQSIIPCNQCNALSQLCVYAMCRIANEDKLIHVDNTLYYVYYRVKRNERKMNNEYMHCVDALRTFHQQIYTLDVHIVHT